MAEHDHHHHSHDHHGHEHAHVTEDLSQAGLDAASESLAQALKVSFKVLTVIIVVLCVLFLARGIFKVDPDTKAMILRFGKASPGMVVEQGLHFSWPFPIDQVERVSVKTKNMEINTFWTDMTEDARKTMAEKGQEPPPRVTGAEQAYMITGDMNILQTRLSVQYRIKSDPQSIIDYYENIGSVDNEEALIRSSVQAAIVRGTAGSGVDKLYPKGQEEIAEFVKAALKREFDDELKSGIEIDQVNILSLRPGSEDVKRAFDRVLETAQAAKDERNRAEQEAVRTLIEAAGEPGPQLAKAIQEWWAAKTDKDVSATDAERNAAAAKMDAAEANISALYKVAGGTVRQVIADAAAYKTSIVELTKGDAAQFEYYMSVPPTDMNVYVSFQRMQAIQEVLNSATERFVYRTEQGEGVKPELRLDINRHPDILRGLKEVKDKF